MTPWNGLFLVAIAGLPLGIGCDSSSAIVPPPTASGVAQPVEPVKLQDATFDDLKFDIEADEDFDKSMLTPQVEALFEKRVRIRGYIYPTLKKRGLKQFVLVRDNLECCFGPGAALYDCILIHMKAGKTAEFSIRPVAVEGTLKFEEFIDYDGTTRAIFRIDGEAVE